MTLSQQVENLEVELGRLQLVEKRLREERDIAREEATQLRALLYHDNAAIPHLPPVRARLLNLLMEREFVPREIAEQAMSRGGTRGALVVHFSMLRKNLPVGVQVLNKRDAGWYIPIEQKTLIRRQA